MIVWIRKKYLVLPLLFFAFVAGMAAILWQGSFASRMAFLAEKLASEPVIILDAGHGGEDGGAVAADGTVESNLNLEIALRTEAVLRFLGQRTKMIRTEDLSVYTEGAETLRQKKVSDLKNRVSMVNEEPNGVLISIHQNCLPSAPRVHGAQVFFNVQAGAEPLAQAVQEELNAGVNTGNEKVCKQIDSTIYLMKNVTVPAILVECGFLSNREETALLKIPDYQRRLAIAVAAGYMAYQTGGEEEA